MNNDETDKMSATSKRIEIGNTTGESIKRSRHHRSEVIVEED